MLWYKGGNMSSDYFSIIIYILIWTCSRITALEHNKVIRYLQISVRARWIWQLKNTELYKCILKPTQKL